MRFLSIETGGVKTCAVGLPGDQLLNIGPGGLNQFADLKSLIKHGVAGQKSVASAISEADPAAVLNMDDVRLLPVLENAGKFICLGLNFSDHAAEGGFDVPDYPALFLRANSSLIAAEAPIKRPIASETLDYEAELAVIVGRSARHVSKDKALDYVFGYSIFNDGSVREHQRKTHQWTAGKNFDDTGAFGPAIVTADELPLGASGLKIQTRLNGEVMQDSNLEHLIFTVADTIALLSEIMTLNPGDVIAMGTPAGVGHARRPPVWMKAGDVCEVEIEGIGVLRNPIVDESLPNLTSQAAEYG